MTELATIRMILSADKHVLQTAGSYFASWVIAQCQLREWVREVEADLLYRDPDGMR